MTINTTTGNTTTPKPDIHELSQTSRADGPGDGSLNLLNIIGDVLANKSSANRHSGSRNHSITENNGETLVLSNDIYNLGNRNA